MVEHVTVDTSVIIASLKKDEEKHDACRKIMEKVKDGDFIALESYIVQVEVAAAIKRRTGSRGLAERIRKDLEAIDTIYFLDLTRYRAREAAEIAEQTDTRGMDAIIAQVAKENNTILITLDKEMADRARDVVRIGEFEKLLKE